jgi:hypothetical protein
MTNMTDNTSPSVRECKRKEKYRTITLTNRAPVRIVEEDWPIIAEGHCGSETSECNIEVRIRRHCDGRAIVYGRFSFDYDYRAACEDTVAVRTKGRVGHLSGADADLAAGLRIVGDYLRERMANADMHKFVTKTIDDCAAYLPPIEG